MSGDDREYLNTCCFDKSTHGELLLISPYLIAVRKNKGEKKPPHGRLLWFVIDLLDLACPVAFAKDSDRYAGLSILHCFGYL